MSTITEKKLTLSDLSMGMKIKDKSQLSNIYDTWVFLIKDTSDDGYTIGYIGKETNSESDELFERGRKICPVYNDSAELAGDIYYEE